MGDVITDNIDVWTSAIKPKAAAGRGRGKGNNGKQELYGIKKLRELILELAVRGLLVEQDAGEEPASVLLKKIAKEKARLVKEGRIKKPKKLAEISEEEKPFVVPDGWEWVRLSEIGHDWGQKVPSRDFTYIDVGAINKELGFVSEPNVLGASEAPSRARKIVKKGTVIYSTVRPYLLNIAVIDEEFFPEPIASTAFAIIHPFDGVLASYIYRYLRSPSFIRYVESCQTGIAYPAVNDKQFFSGLFPLPPLAEQHRIVDKVDELMTLCDHLEQQSEESISAHNTLVETLLSALTNASDHAGFSEAWQRIAEHFNTLFTTEQSIDQLQQTILQLAVMGKLVEQDPNDEPASDLLSNVMEVKERLIKEEGLKTKASDEVHDEDQYITSPASWEWIRLGNLAKFIDYRGKTPKKIESGVRLITAKNVRFGYIDLEPEEFISEEEYVSWMTRGFPLVGDLLFTPEAPLGNIAIIELKEKFALAQRAICFQLHIKDMGQYLKLFIMSPQFQYQLLENATGMTATGIKAAKLKEIPIAIPPLPEQHRITKKVEELTTLCTQLKSRLAAAQTTQLQLADAITDQAIAS